MQVHSMKDKPIIFTGPSVRAILDGTKTQTRRVVKHSKFHGNPDWEAAYADGVPGHPYLHVPHDGGEYGEATVQRLYPKYSIGDRLWVKEQLRGDGQPGDRRVGIMRYGAEGEMVLACCTCGNVCCLCVSGSSALVDSLWHYKRPVLSSMCMPRWASRITLEVTNVRVQRVQEISEEDARAEVAAPMADPMGDSLSASLGLRFQPYTSAFSNTWDSLNAKRGFGWASNPWVFAYTFKRLETKS